MGKSSSYKKKRSKNSSQGRTRKRTKSRSRKYDKSKKLRRRDDSPCLGDDDSRNSMSVSCSSSEDDYRSRRARSHSRKDVKGSKRRTRRRSHSPESREESKKRARRRSYSLESSAEPPRVRKRIGSKRKNGSEVGRKKTHKKNKPRREASVSSMSRASNSCETCWDRSTSSHESEFEKRRGRSERKDKEKKKLKKVKSGTKERRYRSRSHSSCGRSSEGNKYQDEERKAGENNVKRLRSVITVLVEERDDSMSNKDEHKEEIVYDNDDYPSCRSNDSNDGGHKRELDHQSNVASEKKVRVENEEGELVATELTESGREFEGRYIGSNPSSSGAGTNDFVKGKVAGVTGSVAGVTGSVTGDDLESILRQRALENLRRFRGGIQTNANAPAGKKDKSDGDMKQPTTAIADLVQIKIPKEDGAESVGATQELKEISVPALRRDSTCYLPDDYKTLDRKDGGHESGSAKQELACAPDQVALADEQNEKVSSAVGSVINRPMLATPALRHYSLKTYNPVKQTPASDELHQANLLLTESALVKHSAKTAQTMTPSSNYNEDLKDACGSAASESSSCIKSKLAENGSNKPQGETTESSQFEQKTMTVMRGGEMVQVSYKVYIPKKAPALARRQLNR